MTYSRILDFRQVFLTSVPLAQQGKNYIDSYLNQNDVMHLASIMRHHDERPIKSRETFVRDSIDYFIEYFSMLSIAHITGYLSREEILVVAPEITYYLGNAPIRRYYYKNYPLLLPQVLLEMVLDGHYFGTQGETANESLLFEKFHLLNQTIDNEDVNQFLWFLDGGTNDDYDLSDLNAALGNYKQTIQILHDHQRDALGQSMRGFFDYLEFLQQFRFFLDEVHNPLHRSAYWYYHEYWFTRLKVTLIDTVRQFFLGTQNAYDELATKSPSEETLMYLETVKSQNEYEDIVDQLVVSAPYKEEFERFIQHWRGGESMESSFQSNPVPVFE